MAHPASYVSPSAARSSRQPPSWRTPKSKPIELLWRGLAASVRDVPNNPALDLEHALAPYRGADDFELLHVISKAAQQPAATVVSGWASELVGVTVAQWVSSLAPSAFSQLSDEALQLGTPVGGLLRVPSRAPTPQINGSFVCEGQPIPVRRFGLTSTSLSAHKMAVLSEFSRELAKVAVLDLEQIVKSEVLADTRAALDAILLDNVAADAVRPHGLRYNPHTSAIIPGLVPSAITNYAEKIVADIRALLAAVAPASRVALIVNPAQLPGLALAFPNESSAITIIASASATAGTLIAIDLDAFVSASGLPEFSVSESASFHEEDTAPLPLVGGTAQPPVIGSVAAPVRSMWQTATSSVRLIWDVTWTVRRSGSVAWMANVAW